MADNILYLNIALVSLKCLFEVWLFDKGGMDDKNSYDRYAQENFQETCSNF